LIHCPTLLLLLLLFAHLLPHLPCPSPPPAEHHHQHHERHQEVCGTKTFTEVEDRPIVKERVERILEHNPVEKQVRRSIFGLNSAMHHRVVVYVTAIV
jgi:G3E family GTPase